MLGDLYSEVPTLTLDTRFSVQRLCLERALAATQQARKAARPGVDSGRALRRGSPSWVWLGKMLKGTQQMDGVRWVVASRRTHQMT